MKIKMAPEMFTQISGLVYVGLMTNVLLLVGTSPVLVAGVVVSQAGGWVLLAVAAPLVVPAGLAAFAVFARFSDDGATDVVRTFARVWWRSLRRGLLLGAALVVAVVVLCVDIAAVWGLRVGAVAVPVFGVLLLLVVAVGQLMVVGAAEGPGVRIGSVLKASMFLAVRRWYLTAFSLVLLGVLVAVVSARPALGLGVVAAPVLYVVWTNGRRTLRGALG